MSPNFLIRFDENKISRYTQNGSQLTQRPEVEVIDVLANLNLQL